MNCPGNVMEKSLINVSEILYEPCCFTLKDKFVKMYMYVSFFKLFDTYKAPKLYTILHRYWRNQCVKALSAE